MNTRAECRGAAEAGEALFVSLQNGSEQLLFRYLDEVAYVILLASCRFVGGDMPDIDAAMSFVDALDLPAPEGQSRPRMVLRDGCNDWHSIKNFMASGASLIEWASDEDQEKAEEAFKEALTNSKTGEQWVHAVKLVAP